MGHHTQDGDYYLMWGLSSVHLYPQGIAYVKEEADNSKRGYWVNLYTMQEFTEQPKPVKCGPVWLLQIGDIYYIQQIRYMAGIALSAKDFVYNDDVFQFLNDYVILKDDEKHILRLDKGYVDRKDNEYRFKLIPVDSAMGSKGSLSIRRRELPVGGGEN